MKRCQLCKRLIKGIEYTLILKMFNLENIGPTCEECHLSINEQVFENLNDFYKGVIK
jgi:hypothetical protein